MVSKDLFLRVHHITSYWRVLVLDWIRQLLRNHAPFDVTRRLHYEVGDDDLPFYYHVNTPGYQPWWRWRWVGLMGPGYEWWGNNMPKLQRIL